MATETFSYLGRDHIGVIALYLRHQHLYVGIPMVYVVWSAAETRAIYVGSTTQGTKRIYQHARAGGVNLTVKYGVMEVLNFEVEFWRAAPNKFVCENYLIRNLDPIVNGTHLRALWFAERRTALRSP